MANASTGVADGRQAQPSEAVANAWVEWINAEGGIQGHPVELTIRDTKNDTATASRVAKEFIDEGVAAEVGGADSVAGNVWINAFNKAQIPVIGGEIIDPELIAKDEYLFGTDTQVVFGIELFADAAKEAGAKKIGMVLCSESVTCTGAAEIMSPRVDELGMGWAGYVGVSATETNYTAACLAMEQKGIDYIQLGIPAQTAEKVVSDCLKQGTEFEHWGIAYGGFDGKTLKPLSEQGPKFVGSLDSFPWFENVPAIEEYREVMAEYAPDAYYENPVQSATWAGFEMFHHALEGVKLPEEVTSKVVAEALWKVKNEDLGGLLPKKVTYTKGKPMEPINCGWTATLEDAEFGEAKVICRES